jgi:hypothetical protein
MMNERLPCLQWVRCSTRLAMPSCADRIMQAVAMCISIVLAFLVGFTLSAKMYTAITTASVQFVGIETHMGRVMSYNHGAKSMYQSFPDHQLIVTPTGQTLHMRGGESEMERLAVVLAHLKLRAESEDPFEYALITPDHVCSGSVKWFRWLARWAGLQSAKEKWKLVRVGPRNSGLMIRTADIEDIVTTIATADAETRNQSIASFLKQWSLGRVIWFPYNIFSDNGIECFSDEPSFGVDGPAAVHTAIEAHCAAEADESCIWADDTARF